MTLQIKKIIAVLLCLWGSACLQAQTSASAWVPASAPVPVPALAWFTVMGDPADLTVNTVEVDPTPVSVSKDERVMRIRVSRSAARLSWDGVPYQSYTSQVLFDCTHHTAHYVSMDFYLQPGWKGQPYQSSTYSPDEPRRMQFRDVTPNPTQRIIRAVCESASVMSN